MARYTAHDLGGTAGFGPVPATDPQIASAVASPFADRWEAKAFALAQFAQSLAGFTTDAFRHGIERDPDYLEHSYWERWLANAERMLVEGGVLAPDPRTQPRRTTDSVAPTTAGAARPQQSTPRFTVGDMVCAATEIHIDGREHTGHNRLPGYVRGKIGRVERRNGTWVYADTNAHGRGERPTWVYAVAFAADDLWPHAGAHRVCVDLYEPYLEPIDAAA